VRYRLCVSWSWHIYTTIAPPEVVRIEDAYQVALEAYLAEHDDDDDDDARPEAGAGRAPPSPDEVAAYRARFGEALDPEIRARLADCRATISFANVRGEPTDGRLQVSALRFFLERLAPCVFDAGDLSLELGEVRLAQLARARSRGRLGDRIAAKPRKPVQRRAARPGELRAIGVVTRLERAAEDPDARLDLSRAIARLSPAAQRYVELLIRAGACDDAAAARALALPAEAVERAAVELETALAELA
jgi:hypothetical protein